MSAKILAILTPSGYVDDVAEAGDSDGPVGLVLDTTSFYAESGGCRDLGIWGSEFGSGSEGLVKGWCWGRGGVMSARWAGLPNLHPLLPRAFPQPRVATPCALALRLHDAERGMLGPRDDLCHYHQFEE